MLKFYLKLKENRNSVMLFFILLLLGSSVGFISSDINNKTALNQLTSFELFSGITSIVSLLTIYVLYDILYVNKD